jgi:hypothetical protein
MCDEERKQAKKVFGLGWMVSFFFSHFSVFLCSRQRARHMVDAAPAGAEAIVPRTLLRKVYWRTVPGETKEREREREREGRERGAGPI